MNANDGREEIDDNELFNPEILNQDVPYLGVAKVVELIHLFEQQAKGYVQQLQLATAPKQQQLHKFKGAAHSVGLVGLHRLCQQLEQCAEQQPLSQTQLTSIEQQLTMSLPLLLNYGVTLNSEH